MKKIIAIAALLTTGFSGICQDEADTLTLGEKIDTLTKQWDITSKELNSYQGLTAFCLSQEFRTEFIDLMHEVHHYDSVLYQKLLKASRISDDKEIKKAIKDIEKFEGDYSMKKFIGFLHTECADRQDIEKHAKELKSEIGSESYGGQIYILEIELNKYIKHITDRVDIIRKHSHHLHVK